MTRGMMLRIIKNIHSDEYDPEDKLPQYRGNSGDHIKNITKADMLESLGGLWRSICRERQMCMLWKITQKDSRCAGNVYREVET